MKYVISLVALLFVVTLVSAQCPNGQCARPGLPAKFVLPSQLVSSSCPCEQAGTCTCVNGGSCQSVGVSSGSCSSSSGVFSRPLFRGNLLGRLFHRGRCH